MTLLFALAQFVTKDFISGLEQQTLQLLPNPLPESSAISQLFTRAYLPVLLF
jgi:hypothetical protein